MLTYTRKDSFLCINIHYVILFLNFAFESLEVAGYFMREVQVKICLC